MKLKRDLMSVGLTVCALLMEVSNLSAQSKIIIKLDDIGAKNNTCQATPVMDVLVARKVKAGLDVNKRTKAPYALPHEEKSLKVITYLRNSPRA